MVEGFKDGQSNHQASFLVPGEGSYYHQTTHVRWMLGKELTILEKSLRMQPKQANPWLKKMKEDLVLKREQDASF